MEERYLTEHIINAQNVHFIIQQQIKLIKRGYYGKHLKRTRRPIFSATDRNYPSRI